MNSTYKLPSAVAGAHTDPIDALHGNRPTKDHTVQIFLTGAPSACTFSLWGSTKQAGENPAFPADFQNLSGPLDATVETMAHVPTKPVATVVVSLDTISGGTTPTVAFGYRGY